MIVFDKSKWKKVAFGDVCKNLNITERNPVANGIKRYVGLEHIESGNLKINTWGNISEGTTFTKTFKPGHILFGKRRAYLKKAAVADFTGICSGDILVFEANENVIHRRLFPFLVSSDRFFDHAIQTSAGSLSPRTKFQDLAKFQFLLPPKEQQEKLVELLWAGHETIEKYNTLLNRLTEGKQNSIDRLIGEVRDEQDSEYKCLCEFGDLKNGINKSKEDFGFGFPFVNLMDVFGKPTIKAQKFDLVNASKSDLLNFDIKKGDVLFVRSSVKPSGVGLTTLVLEDIPNTVYSGFIIRFRQNKNILRDDYLEYCFHETLFRNDLLKNSTISANTNINQQALGGLEIIIPSVERQERIAGKIAKIDQSITKVSIHLSLFVSIQKQLINLIFTQNA